MKKDEIIAFLQQLVESQKQQLESQKHLVESQNRQIDDLLRQVASLTDEVASLKVLLVQKGEEEEKTKRALKVLGKLNHNKSEKQTPPAQESETPGNNNNTATEESHGKKERPHTNNGAKRKVYYDIETVIKDVYPDDPAFDSQMASHIGFDEVVRYELVPMKFRKVIYRVHKYSQRGVLMEGKTPMAPFLNSNYDGSFIAGISHLRFMYSMPVERIVKYFGENGFDMPKQTAHGLLAKTENLFEKLNEALKMTVKTDSYGCADETYHKILVKEKNKDGKGIKNGYIWGFLAVNLGLVYFFYCRGSRGADVFFEFIRRFTGAFQSDGYRTYKSAGKWFLRLACFQHVKRKFLDCGEDFDCKVIVRLINYIYHLDHKHSIGQDGWTEAKHRKWRKDMCKPIMKIIRKKLDRMAADKTILPKTEKYDAVHYMLGEWDALMNIFKRGDYHLDNNDIERLNRYISLSRRNSLFFGSHKGAGRGAMFYSLVCSCRLNGVNFFEYISDVINKAAALPPNTPLEKYRMLLPDKWKENR